MKPHAATPECWCHPVEVEPGLWMHNQMNGEVEPGSPEDSLEHEAKEPA